MNASAAATTMRLLFAMCVLALCARSSAFWRGRAAVRPAHARLSGSGALQLKRDEPNQDKLFDYSREIIEQHERAKKKLEMRRETGAKWLAGTMRKAEQAVEQRRAAGGQVPNGAAKEAAAPGQAPAAAQGNAAAAPGVADPLGKQRAGQPQSAPTGAPAAPSAPTARPAPGTPVNMPVSSVPPQRPAPGTPVNPPASSVPSAAAAVAPSTSGAARAGEPEAAAPAELTLEDFLTDCEGLGRVRVVVVGKGAILEAPGEFGSPKLTKTPEGRFVTFRSADAGIKDDFELHLRVDEIKAIEMVEKPGRDGGKLLVTRLNSAEQESLLMVILRANTAPEAARLRWYAMREIYGPSYTFGPGKQFDNM